MKQISHSRSVKLSNTKSVDFSWKFDRIEIGPALISCVRCTLQGSELEVTGYGEALWLGTAVKKCLAEAWERWWLLYLIKSDNDEWKFIESSNGFAAALDRKLAVQAAQHELIERQILLNAWQSQEGWSHYKPKSLLANFIISLLAKWCWRGHFYLLESDTGHSILCGIYLHDELGSIFDATYLNRNNKTKAELKLTLSLLRSAKISESTPIDPKFELGLDSQPSDHAKFYRNPYNNKAFDFLKTQPEHAKINLDRIKDISTKVIYDLKEMPSVAVAFHPSWTVLRWGTQSIAGKNPWPHPLA